MLVGQPSNAVLEPAGKPGFALGPAPAADLPIPRARTYLGAILLVGGLLRIALWLGCNGNPLRIWDERDYNTLAVNLIRHHQFAFDIGRPTSLRPPLYPAVVATVYRFLGAENYQAVRLLQAGMSLLTVLLVYGLGSELDSRRVGVWLAALYGFYPSLLGYNNLLLSEVQFTALLCAACYALAAAYRRGSIPPLVLVGVLLGLAALTRSILWPFPVILGLYLLATWPGNLGRRLVAVGSLVAAFAITLAPWAIRNMRLERTLMTVDCMGGRNFMMGNYDYTPMFRAWDAISEEGARSWHQVLAQADPISLASTQGQKDKRALRYGVAFAISHPGLTVQRDLVKFGNFWGLERELLAGVARGYYGAWPAPAILFLTLVIPGAYVLALLSGVFGMVVVPPRDRRLHGLLILVIAFICGMHTLTFGHSRYHLPVMPLVLLYSAAALVRAGAIWERRRSRAFRLACGLSALFVLVWSLEIGVVYRENVVDLLHKLI